MKVEFAPLNTPLARRPRAALAPVWFVTFALLAEIWLGSIVILIIYNYWFLYIPHLTWPYLDWQTPDQRGRRFNWIKSWTIWRYFKDYFPMHLIKTWDLDPSHNYIFGLHSHGVLVAGAFGNFCIDYACFKKLVPGFLLYIHVLHYWLCCPFFQWYSGVQICVECPSPDSAVSNKGLDVLPSTPVSSYAVWMLLASPTGL